jgi:uncharacterized coiled-coil DUF342 family protein
MTIDERIEALLKSSEDQGKTMDKILAGFREFREDRSQINLTLRSLIENVDKLTTSVSKLESLFTRSLTKPPNGKPE